MHVFDSRSLQGGVLPLIHLDYDKPRGQGPAWELDLRHAVFACRIHGETWPADSGTPIKKKILPKGEIADLTGAFMWYSLTRPISTMGWAFPSIVTERDTRRGIGAPDEPFGRSNGGTHLRPLTYPHGKNGNNAENWDPDDRYMTLPTGTPSGQPVAPKGMHGITTLSSAEHRQAELFMFTDPRLCAPHRGGRERNGSVLVDVDPRRDTVDGAPAAHAQTLFRVTHNDEKWQWSLNCGPSPKGGGGFGLCYLPGEDVYNQGYAYGLPTTISHLTGGPWCAGHVTADEHKTGMNVEGENEQPVHLWHRALLYRSKIEDGPSELTVFRNGGNAVTIVKVYKGWDSVKKEWRRWTTVPIIPETWDEYEDPGDIVPGGGGGGGGGRRGGPPSWGGGGGGGSGQPGGGDGEDEGGGSPGDERDGDGDARVSPVPHPGPGEDLDPEHAPGNPSLHERELAVKSLQGTSGRHKSGMPGDGPYGGKGQDTEGPVDADGNTIDTDAMEAAARERERQDRLREKLRKMGLEGVRDPDDPSIERDPETGLEITGASDAVKSIYTELAESERILAELARQDIELQRGKPGVRIRGRRGNLSEDAIARGGPSPLTWHLWGLAEVEQSATTRLSNWLYKSVPGRHWGNGTAKAGALMIGPHVLPDGRDDQSDWIGELDVLLYNGNLGGSAVRRFGWGDYDQPTDTWRDGAVIDLDGSSGAYDPTWRFRDAAGAVRADGVWGLDGAIRLKEYATVPGGTPAAGFGKIFLRDGQPDDLVLADSNGETHRLVQVTWVEDPIVTPTGSSGVFWAHGFYDAPAADANLDEGALSFVTNGGATQSHASHAFAVVSGVGSITGVGVVALRVSGVSIDDSGNRNGADTEDIITDISSASAVVTNAYFESTKKWLGTVTWTLVATSGTPTAFSLDFNYGFAKYEDFGNVNFDIHRIQVTGRAGANDSGFNLELLQHPGVALSWTYSAAAFAPGGTVLANMNTDHGAEKDLVSGEPFAYKRSGLATPIVGDNDEGFVFRITTSANKAVEVGNVRIGVHET